MLNRLNNLIYKMFSGSSSREDNEGSNISEVVDFVGVPLLRTEYKALQHIFAKIVKEKEYRNPAIFYNREIPGMTKMAIEDRSVIELDLSSWGGLTSLPQDIKGLTKLRRLDLSKNPFISFDGIGVLQNLQYLNISHNELSSVSWGVEELVSLRVFDASYNELKSFPGPLVNLRSLRDLDLSANQITSLHGIEGISGLSWLNVAKNQIEFFPSLSVEVEKLNFNSNHLASLPSSIAKFKNLKELCLSNNRLTSLPPEIGRLPNLQFLSIDNNNLTKLPYALTYLPKLKGIDFLGNKLDERCIEILDELKRKGVSVEEPKYG